MMRSRFTRQAPPENLHPLAQGSQAVSTHGNNGLERMPCNAQAACKARLRPSAAHAEHQESADTRLLLLAYFFSEMPNVLAVSWSLLSLVQRGVLHNRAEARRWISIQPIPFP